jgi:hypothetical protein
VNRGRADFGEILGEHLFPKLRKHKFAQRQPGAARISTVATTPDHKEVTMKTQIRIAVLSLLTILCLMLAVAPAMADSILYDNGPSNDAFNAWNISDGHAVSDSLVCRKAGKDQQEYMRVSLSEAIPTTVEWSIGTSPFAGDIASGTASLTILSSFINEFGYNVDDVSFSTGGVDLSAGTTYWLTVQNATTSNGNPVYWDENSGPSQAYDSALGTIPSEAFTIYGSGSSTPEPSSLLLFGSGVLGIGGLLRKRLFG